MIRDPSDGSVRSKPLENKVPSNFPIKSESSDPLIDTSTSGLPITKAKDLARLEESRKWLESYVRPTING